MQRYLNVSAKFKNVDNNYFGKSTNFIRKIWDLFLKEKDEKW